MKDESQKTNQFIKFDNIKYHVLTEVKGIIISFKERRWSEFFGRFIFSLFMMAIAGSLIINAFSIVYSASVKIKNSVWPGKTGESYPPKILTYKNIINNEKIDGGIYRNLYKLSLTNPAGNIDSANPYIAVNFGQRVECSYGSDKGFAEIGIGLATTTITKLADCKTEKVVIDDGNLFSIIASQTTFSKDTKFNKDFLKK